MRHWRLAATLVASSFSLVETGLEAQSSSLSGSVLVSPGNRPLAGAEILLPALKISARSDSAGRFRLGPFAAGTHEIVVRSIGYNPSGATITFRDSSEIRADFLVSAVTALETIDVRGKLEKRWADRLVEFEQRRAGGMGSFITYDKIEKNSSMDLSSLLSSLLPGLRFMRAGGSQVAISARGGRNCAMQVLLNRMNMYNGESLYFDINSLETGDLLGAEFYNAFNTPSEFNIRPRGPYGGSRCGTLILWMK